MTNFVNPFIIDIEKLKESREVMKTEDWKMPEPDVAGLIRTSGPCGRRIIKCGMTHWEQTTALYNVIVRHLEQNINYPQWVYGVYPSGDSVKTAIEAGVQYLCLEGDQAIGAFILNNDQQGNYELGQWQADLPVGSYLVIHTLAVHPDQYGKGVGRYMVQYCIEEARRLGYPAIRLDAVPDNVPARKLYEKMGFSFAGEKDLQRPNNEQIPLFALYELNF